MFMKSSLDWHKASKVEIQQKDKLIQELKLQLGQQNSAQARCSLPDKQWEPNLQWDSNSRWNQPNNYFGERSGRDDEKRSSYHYSHNHKSDNRGFSERPRWISHRRKSYNERSEACRNSERWNSQPNRHVSFIIFYLIKCKYYLCKDNDTRSYLL